jgi:alkanesulfonate monooxygenase SsuD/methylene tetrahydromethanopterin reductase-like flavin-dependent oxidoreductase (luciferase family)
LELVFPANVSSGHGVAAPARGDRDVDLDVVDPWVALAAAAVATRRVQLGPLVTPLARRRPWNVARAAVISLDHLSGGRFILGVGLGTVLGPEFAAFGEEIDVRRRGDMLDEGIGVLRGIWSGEPVHFDGEHYRIDGVRFLPAPSRPAGIPIWAATQSLTGRPVRRAAGVDGIVPIDITPADLPVLLENVRSARGKLTGYDIVTISTSDDAESWQAAGATWWLRELPWQQSYAECLAVVNDGPRR